MFQFKSATEWLAWFNKPKFLSFPSLHQCKQTYKSLIELILIPSIDRRRQITSKHASHWPNYHRRGWSEANAHILSASWWKYSDQLGGILVTDPNVTLQKRKMKQETIIPFFSVLIRFKFAFRGLPLKKKIGCAHPPATLGLARCQMTLLETVWDVLVVAWES